MGKEILDREGYGTKTMKWHSLMSRHERFTAEGELERRSENKLQSH